MQKQTTAKRPTTAAEPDAEQVERRFPIVAIGASAGGLEALEQFLSHVPADSGMAFVVIQHLDPTAKGMLPELLQRATPMPVAQATDRMKVRPGRVYVIPPNRDLSILRDNLHLLVPVAPRGLRLPVDYFFRALADDRHEHAIGVILSGMGSDGTRGLRAIKEHGGLALVQDPATAKFDGMPRSAIDHGLADMVASAEALPLRIVAALRQSPCAPSALAVEDAGEKAAEEVAATADTAAQRSAFDSICILLRKHTSHDFSRYKKSAVYRRIERRMAIHRIGRIADYVRYLYENTQEVDLLFKELLIGVTRFFRDPASWAYLKDPVLHEQLAATRAGSALRAWVAGCSTGEEAYSLAITFREAQDALRPPRRHTLQIFATDLDPDAIEQARLGVYPATIAADVSENHLKRYFVDNDGNGYRVSKEIREMVVFAPHNLIMDPPYTRLDILTCRNLLIYLNPELQSKLLPLFHYSLKPEGILMLGSAESIGTVSELFAPIEGKARLYRRSASPSRPAELEFPTRALPTQTESHMETTQDTSPTNLQHCADQLLLQQFSPAAVLVTSAGDLLYISGHTGKYLEPPAGKVNWNIHAMAREGLRQELSLALPKALRSGERVACRNLQLDASDTTQTVDLTVHPLAEPPTLRGMAMVVFTDVAAAPPPVELVAGRRSPRSGPSKSDLARTLSQVQMQAHALSEEMQSSQQELRSANEELQSTIEELQSTNEELTTSKEELQSLNEELQTVNAELQSKVDELSAANNDLKNLLDSTDMATVFLDNALHLRRFTTQATRLFKLIPGDIGRPLSDIVTDLIYPGLLDDADEVLRSLAFFDREITTRDGRWFQVKIMPYRTLDNVIDGVVITFNDISRAKQLEAQLRDTPGATKESP